MYGIQAGATLKYVAFILYPTTASNNRSDLPQGQNVVPKMQLAGQSPIFADAAAKYPLVVWSHGRGSAPVDGENLPAAVQLASHGYVVCVLFHGDNRFPQTTATNLTEWEQFTLRPLTVKSAIDALLASPAFSSNIDPNRIGGLGRSFGGGTFMALAGGKIAGPTLLATRSTVTDSRIKATAGVVPLLGQSFFGFMNAGISGVSAPFMAVTAANDEFTTQSDYLNVIGRLAGVRYLVKIDGETHGLSTAASTDAMTWAIYFLNAQVAGNATAQSVLGDMLNVVGGATDNVL
jgi:predicted dienelactone hydrolase